MICINKWQQKVGFKKVFAHTKENYAQNCSRCLYVMQRGIPITGGSPDELIQERCISIMIWKMSNTGTWEFLRQNQYKNRFLCDLINPKPLSNIYMLRVLRNNVYSLRYKKIRTFVHKKPFSFI